MTFATTFIMRGQHEAGRYDLSRRSLQWLYEVGGGRMGAYYEHIPVIRSSMYFAGLLPWSSAEVPYFMVHHMIGIKFENGAMTIFPAIYRETFPLKADLRYKQSRIDFEVSGHGKVKYAIVNGKKIKTSKNGKIILDKNFEGGTVKVVLG